MDRKSIDNYINEFPPETQNRLSLIRNGIANTVAGLDEAISYGIPTFRYKGENLVHFAGFENHIGFYPSPSGIAAFKEDLKAYKTATGSVQFPLTKPVPLELIIEITKFRISEIDQGK